MDGIDRDRANIADRQVAAHLFEFASSRQASNGRIPTDHGEFDVGGAGNSQGEIISAGNGNSLTGRFDANILIVTFDQQVAPVPADDTQVAACQLHMYFGFA
jgi:hypothetical protein